METAPSGGEFLPSIRSRETQDNKEHQTISPGTNSSPSHLHDVNTHQLEESDEKQDSSVSEKSDIPNNSLLRLFQSSDDMEVEFLGFED
ncbi:hypothetical protein KUCAC02_037889 [Chaenocephalus aceratus]|nr:hypothetical protein KUCAC02_037889 [Chaenocephalus aceratus]